VCDEMWSFVAKSNKQWIWLVIDRDSREIIGMHVGNRDRTGAKALWNSLPQIYRQCAVCYTEFWSAYEQIIPSERHCAVGKESGSAQQVVMDFPLDLSLLRWEDDTITTY